MTTQEGRYNIHRNIANALAAYTLATRSYTVLDRLANAISADAVCKAIYELGRSLDVIIRNSKEDQAISYDEKKDITIKRGGNKFTIKGCLPNEYEYKSFLDQAIKDIIVARGTAAYAAALIARASGAEKDQNVSGAEKDQNVSGAEKDQNK